MQPQEIESTIREYIEQVIHMSLATSADGKPWVCEVHYSYDDALNLYIRTHTTARHSQEIAANPYVAGTIVTQHFKNQKPRGVYFEGRAELLEDVDVSHPAYQAAAGRYGEKAANAALPANSETLRYYQITVANWYVFDAYTSDPAQKYQLPWNA